LNGVFLSLDKNVVQKPKKPIAKKYLVGKQKKSTERLEQVGVKVFSKSKTCLKDI
jgi:hypothetical protein